VRCVTSLSKQRHMSSALLRQHQHNYSHSAYSALGSYLFRIVSPHNAAMSFMSSFAGSSRAGYAPRRGRGRGGRAPFTKGREQINLDIEKHPLGVLLKTFHSSDLGVGQSNSTYPAAISDCQYVASYNWLNDRDPTIIVPGNLFFHITEHD
jgi:hypothetical protein